jgi:hypothetical protein
MQTEHGDNLQRAHEWRWEGTPEGINRDFHHVNRTPA